MQCSQRSAACASRRRQPDPAGAIAAAALGRIELFVGKPQQLDGTAAGSKIDLSSSIENGLYARTQSGRFGLDLRLDLGVRGQHGWVILQVSAAPEVYLAVVTAQPFLAQIQGFSGVLGRKPGKLTATGLNLG